MAEVVALRSYRKKDEVATVELWRECRLLRPWNDSTQDIQRCIVSPSSDLILAVREQQLVGSVMLGHDGHRGWVYYLAVSPHVQRCGIGRLLMEYAEVWMTERKIPKLQAMVRVDNLLVHGFYRKLGYLTGDVQLVEKFLNRPGKENS